MTRIEPGGFTKVSALGIDEQRVRAMLGLTAVDTTALGHDERVYNSIAKWRGENVLRVPLSAPFRQGEDWLVFVARNSRVLPTAVELDHRNVEVAEVFHGLSAKDFVILHPSDRIAHRSRVDSRRE